MMMIQPNNQDLKYGVIYVYFDPLKRADSLGGKDLIEKIAYPFAIEWIEDPGRGDDNTLLVARRFNVGNVGHCATVSLRMSNHNPHGVQFDALHEFREKLFEVTAADDGDIVIDETQFGVKYSFDSRINAESISLEEPPLPQAAPQDKTYCEPSKKRFKFGCLRDKLRDLIAEEDDGGAAVVTSASSRSRDTVEDLLEKEEKNELAAIERKRKQALEGIKRDIINYIAQYHEDPKDLMQELLRGKVVVGTPGRVLVNGDMKIVLPDYDELEIEMPAMCRTLYILFMKHRKQGGDGIVLMDMDQYRDELIDIYGLVKPGASDDRVERTVDNLCAPASESLNQTISRINRCIRNVITDKQLARSYCIIGNRGRKYGIGLDPQYLELPRAVTGE